MKFGRWFLAVYLTALAASHLVRGIDREEPRDPTRAVLEVADPDVPEAPVRIAYRDHGPAELAPVLVLLHGSPGSANDFRGLEPLLEQHFRLIAPDLPGFGSSSRSVSDYSIRAHARYAHALIEALGLESVHLVGFSMGGGVALELAEIDARRVASVTLLSSIGVQEFELLGNYQINHAVHGAQLLALTVLQEAVPHFGALDDFPLNRAYGRNFYDTDQRPLRSRLEGLEVPALVLHGERDSLVPIEAAREHHRLVPQSELVTYDSGHFIAFQEPEQVAASLTEFVSRVERGEARTRAAAEPSRITLSRADFDPETLPRATGITRLVWILLIVLATLISEDLTCIGAGLLVAQGRLDLATAIFASGIGIFVGDLGLFALGRYLGRPWLRRAPLKWLVSEERLEAASTWFRAKGPAVVFLSRFTPGMRLPTFVTAGLLETAVLRFVLYFALAVALWTPVLVIASAAIGDPLFDWFARNSKLAAFAVPATLATVWMLVAAVRSLTTWRGRRLWVGRLCRLRKWEFWPAWLFYVPVAFRILGLAITHRSPTVFTAANPAIPDGGFVGESKSAILERLPAEAVARFIPLPRRLTATERRSRVEGFLLEHGLKLPVVVKPDVGERGRDVTICRDSTELDRALLSSGDLIAQEFIGGVELGVFYVRHPKQRRGRIFSITEKRLLAVTGDGHSSLEALILEDPRAVCMAPTFLERHRAHLQDVLEAREVRQLVQVGTHCRGALFLDGSRFHTPELEAEIDRISQDFDGFYFGRFDIKAPNEEALLNGRELRVLELNGVTSEATHIYDPSSSLGDAYRTLFEQWTLAFEIGAENRARGVKPTSLLTLTRIVWQWLSGSTIESS